MTDRIQLTPVALMEGMAMAKTMFSEAVGWDGCWSLGMCLLYDGDIMSGTVLNQYMQF